MSEIHKIEKNGVTIYPATTTDAVVDADVRKSLKNILRDNKLTDTGFSAKSTNLANPEKIMDELSVRSDGSMTHSSTGYGVIVVPIDEEGLYISEGGDVSGARYHALYDKDMNYIPGTATQSLSLPYVENAVWAAFSVQGQVMINKGNQSMPYEDFDPLQGYPITANSEIYYPNQTNDYSGCVSELYCIAPIPENYTLGLKQRNGTLYFRPYSGTTYAWQATVNMDGWENHQVYELKCSTAGSGVEVGDTVGYIVFKDIDKFKGINSGTTGEKVYINKALNLSGSIQITNYLYSPVRDQSITEEKLSPELLSKFTTILQPVKKYEKYYIHYDSFNIVQTTSSRGINIYKVLGGNTYKLDIPLNGNSYATTYAYLDDLDSLQCVAPSDPIRGSESPVNIEIKAEDHPYLAICYTMTNGEPSVTTPNNMNEETVTNIVKKELEESGVSLLNGIDMLLPDEIVAVEGDSLQIFWRSIIQAVNPYNFDVIGVFPVGKSYPRYYTYTPIIGDNGKTYTLKIQVRNNDTSIMIEKETTIKVVSKPSSPLSLIKILCVGASATANGEWIYELKRRLTMSDGDGTPAIPTGLGLTNIEFVGRKTGTSKDVNLEATGGWRVQDYAGEGRPAYRFYVSGITQLHIGDTYLAGSSTFTITEINVTDGNGNIRCTYTGSPSIPENGILTRSSGTGNMTITYTSYESESYNPFWNSSSQKLDFKGYAEQYCGGSIDLMVWHCGVNDIFGGDESIIPTVIESYSDILRAYHQDFPTGKVILSSVPIGSPIGGFGANYGASSTSNYYTFLKIAQKYAKALFDLCIESEFSSFVLYSAVLEEFDAENAYPYEEEPVNNRIVSVKERLGTNGVHPIAEGSYMVADSMYRAFSKLDF